MSEIVYLDHQASTPLAPGVLDAMLPHLNGICANPHSSHFLGMRSNQAIEQARQKIAGLFNVDGAEIFFVSGATEANNIILKGALEKLQNHTLITIKTEHKSILSTARYLSSIGKKVEYINVDCEGYLNISEIEDVLYRHRPSLMSVMIANNEIGTIQNIKEISEVCKKHDSLLHSDMAQGIQHTDISLGDIAVDFASFSAHKMNGPKGVGALYIGHHMQKYISPLIHGGGQEKGVRSGTLATALCVGFGEAAQYWCEYGSEIRQQTKALRDLLWDRIKTVIPTTRLIGPKLSERHVANLNIHIPSVDAELLLGMTQNEIAASTGSACTAGIPEPSHVIYAIQDSQALADGSIRLSISNNNTVDEIYRAVDALSNNVSIFQK